VGRDDEHANRRPRADPSSRRRRVAATAPLARRAVAACRPRRRGSPHHTPEEVRSIVLRARSTRACHRQADKPYAGHAAHTRSTGNAWRCGAGARHGTERARTPAPHGHERHQALANAIRGRLVVAHATAPAQVLRWRHTATVDRLAQCVAHAQAISWSCSLATPCPLSAALPRGAPYRRRRRGASVMCRYAQRAAHAARRSPIPRGQSLDQRSLIVELLAHGGALAAETGVIGDHRAGRLQRTLLV